jgi:hypothetical protein
MSEMVERVAKAIASERVRRSNLSSPSAEIEEVAFARAAIAAMREPTPEMINSVWASSGDILAWKAFIDEALK